MQFGNDINTGTLQRVKRYHALIEANPFPGFYAAVPAYATLSIFYNPVEVMQSPELSGADCINRLTAYLKSLDDVNVAEPSTCGTTVNIPVCYGGKFGPDLSEVAAVNGLSEQQVIQLHNEAVYTVYMIGFVPGFAYLGGMNSLLATPRKQQPRVAVPAGAVGIGGNQTGVYPLATPGGWQLIGQTPLQLFDAASEQPSLLKAGDTVVFKPISADEFNNYLITGNAAAYN
ncbi:allophanate hydrolase subunit 1 [Mucilaginibacter hurinus]|uniref:Allophanate hydrolase subunit 1 n=2 Tax=Mucilaginibacter hurinus TaxID=2201324 RepID=A0A367GS56_9SPHI|nr:allophanate hydrolase subunit 1 [Mucilaginibacter hurinus]